MNKPTVFVASPYSAGDAAMNTHFQCRVFDKMLNDGRVLPIVPLWSHFQHTLFPRPYEEWVKYDQEMLHLYDCCLRLDAVLPEHKYHQSKSSGADGEVRAFIEMGKPVFYSMDELYYWVDNTWNKQA